MAPRAPVGAAPAPPGDQARARPLATSGCGPSPRSRSRRRPRGWLPFLAASWALAAAGPAQQEPFEVALRDGRVWTASAITGDPGAGFDVVTAGERRHVDAEQVLLVHRASAQVAALPSVHLPDGDVVYGNLVGGDAAGNQVEVLSPVLGRLPLHIDRVSAIAAAGVRGPQRLRLPEGVGEAIFLRATIGYDVLAGSLHRCGERGLLFAPDGKDPAWFATDAFVALRIGDPTPRRAPAGAWLTTRTGDRLGVSVRRLSATGLQCELDSGAMVELRAADLACLSFADVGTFLSDLPPVEVVESGFEAEVLHPWRRDQSALGDPLVVAGRTHGKGLGVHSRSRLVFEAPADAAHFWTRVGLDDSSPALGVTAKADVRVLIDGAVKFERRALGAGAAQDTGLLPVRPGQRVALEVDFGPGRDIGDRVDWLSPVFLPAAGRRP
jgi:hypothetical protein